MTQRSRQWASIQQVGLPQRYYAKWSMLIARFSQQERDQQNCWNPAIRPTQPRDLLVKLGTGIRQTIEQMQAPARDEKGANITATLFGGVNDDSRRESCWETSRYLNSAFTGQVYVALKAHQEKIPSCTKQFLTWRCANSEIIRWRHRRNFQCCLFLYETEM